MVKVTSPAATTVAVYQSMGGVMQAMATGTAAEARRLFTDLLYDHERVLGHDNADTLRSRNKIAHWTTRAAPKDSARALRGQ